MIMTGVGVGLSISTLSSSATVFLKPTQLAMGSALNTTGRQIGTALGAALSLAIAAPALARIEQFRTSGLPIDVSAVSEIHTAWNMNAGIYFAAGIIMIIIFRAPTEAQMDDARAEVVFED